MRCSRHVMLFLSVAFFFVFVSPKANAVHGLSDNHVADQDITYRLHTGSLSSAQRASIEGASEEWRTEIGKSLGGLSLLRGSNYTGSTPKAFRDASANTRLVWEDNYPNSGGFLDCTYPQEIACSEVDWNESAPEDHITDYDVVFHENIAWPSGNVECAAGQGDPDATDASDGALDQFTIALHEFGHAFHLKDAISSGSLMSPAEDNMCWRDISDHDHDTAYEVYDFPTQPGHSHVAH